MKKLLVVLVVFIILFSSFRLAWSQEATVREQEWREHLAQRYDVAGWSGRDGGVVAGLRLDEFDRRENPFHLDNVEWLELKNGERAAKRHFTTADRGITLSIAVTRTCRGAHELLFDHLARPRSMKPHDPPMLPYGEIRMDAIGDVCFALPLHDEEGFHTVEFVRRNVVVLLQGEDEEGGALMDLAYAVDQILIQKKSFPRWQEAEKWPSISRFQASLEEVKTGTKVPLLIASSCPGNEPLATFWEVTAGGVLQEKGKTFYYAEGEGKQTLTLLLLSPKGLAATGSVSFRVLK